MDHNVEAIAELFGMSTAEPPASGKVGRTAEESRLLGQDALADGRYSEALDHFRRVLDQNPEDPRQALIELAETHAYGDDEPAALRLYRRAKAAGDSNIGAAEVYRRYGRQTDAIVELRLAVAAEPMNPYPLQKLSETLVTAGFTREGLVAAEAAVALAPATSYYHFAVAELHAKLGELQEAIESYRAAVELSPGDDHLLLRTAAVFWRAGRHVEAIKAVRLASDLVPERAMYHGLIRLMLLATGDAETAALENKRAEEMDRYDIDLIGRFGKETGLPV